MADPVTDTTLRSNLGTWAVPSCQVPAVAYRMTQLLPTEAFDPNFEGQCIATTYLDTPDFDLRKARREGDRYLTLRVRCYGDEDDGPTIWALSAKTEGMKWRQEIGQDEAQAVLQGDSNQLMALLPGDLAARLLELTGDIPVEPVVCISGVRYAVEEQQERLTLDLDVKTDTGKCLECGVLEFKSVDDQAPAPGSLVQLKLRPIKLSKFLWATLWR